MTSVLKRFLKYVNVDTQSHEDIESVPSTGKQKTLTGILAEELKTIGAGSVKTDGHGYVYAVIPSNLKGGRTAPAIGFLSHMDTSPDVSGENVKPRIVESYDGSDIVLNAEQGYVLSASENPSLKKYVGRRLVVTDGTTLLGADDKAGIAEIMSMAESILSHPEIEHGEIRIGFTPDEEVGRGMDFFDVDTFGAKFAYTVDGGELGEIEYENFNAAGAAVYIKGYGIHPGSAKNRMVNAALLAMEFQSMLPVSENPAFTDGYEGFYHLTSLEGTPENATAHYIIRDHDLRKFSEKKARMQKIAAYLNEKYGEATFTVEIKDSYLNMKEKIEPHMHLIDNAKAAMEAAGIDPAVVPIRGGTDGARLSYMGVPCPNLCTGGVNFHSRYEYIPVESMEKMTDVLLNLVGLYAGREVNR